MDEQPTPVRFRPGVVEQGTGFEAAPEPGARARIDEAPFDVRVARPRALDVLKLYELADKPVPAEIRAALGTTLPLLLVHGVTAFQTPGRATRAVWGMGYEVALSGVDADTVSLEPGTSHLEVGSVDQEIAVGLSAGGSFGVSDPVARGAALAIGLPSAEIRATTNQSFGLALHFRLRLLKVEAGRVGAGGAKWNFYEQDSPLNGEQMLFQTLTARPGAAAFRARITTWVRSRGFLGFGSVFWQSEPEEFEVRLS